MRLVLFASTFKHFIHLQYVQGVQASSYLYSAMKQPLELDRPNLASEALPQRWFAAVPGYMGHP